jgi:alkylation response protein AidB-like acyl-CoA dehydrogenase
MALLLTDEQMMLRDSVRSFLTENAPVEHLRRMRDSRHPQGFSRALWKSFVDLGLTGVIVPEAYSGLGLGYVDVGVIMEEIGHFLTPTPFLSTAVLGTTALTRGGTEAHKTEYLPRIARGERIVALAVEESPKHAPLKTAFKATRAGQAFRLDGIKTFVVDGHVADLLIIPARTAGVPGDADGITLFLVESTANGVFVERTLTVDSHNAARVSLTSCMVSAENVLGEVDGGFRLLEGILNAGRAAVSCELLGVADEAFTRTTRYLKERRQYGKAIGEFQALQHRAAHLYTELEITRAAVLKALQTLDEDFETATAIVAVAKARAGATATLAVQEAVQMHGGIGMTDEFEIGFFMKRARVCQELFGDANFHADRLARLYGY